MRILLTGKNGQIGSELTHLLAGIGELTAVGRNELHLAKPADIRRVIAQARPNLIINTAAYTAVDQAEKEEGLARTINAEAPAVMAEEAKKIGALLIHYSTDYVFDGSKRSPYSEEDATNPLSAYGRTKLAGEEAVRASGASHLILRTAWLYATSGKNFLVTILRLASSREELRIVNDQFGAPTWAREIARATARILRVPAIPLTSQAAGGLNIPAATGPEREDALGSLVECSGTYHLTAAGVASWCDFAVAIIEAARQVPCRAAWLASATGGHSLIVKRIIPITTEEYPTPARRPAYSVLSSARFADTFGFSLPDWRSQLSEAVRS